MAIDKLGVYQLAVRHLADARLALITDDVETRYALDDAWPRAVDFVLRQAAWKFALKDQVLITQSGTAAAGFSLSYAKPTDLLRTHAAFVVAGATAGAGIECPIDIREGGVNFSTNTTGQVVIRYVSSDYEDPELAGHPWPEHFAQVVGTYLAFLVAERVTGERSAPARMSQLFSSILPEAIALDALPENPWLRFQLDGRFQLGARNVCQMEHWRYALKTAANPVQSGTPIPGYQFSFPLPADWICTHDLFLGDGTGRENPFDAREHEGFWSTNIAAFTVRYTSATRAFDSTLWPDLVRRAVLAYLEFEESGEELGQPGYTPPSTKAGATKAALWQSALAAAKEQEAVDDSPWFQAQIDGSFVRAARQTLMAGYWRFALKEASFTAEDILTQSGTPAIGYPYRYARPTDWLKTHAAFVPYDGREIPFDLREDVGPTGALQWSTFCQHFAVRYLSSTLGLDSTLWPDPFANAVLACLDYAEDEEPEESQKAPAQGPPPGAAAAAAWQKALGDALTIASEPENQWWRFQRDGRFLSAAHAVLEAARWRFAIATVDLTADVTLNADNTTSGTIVPTPLGPGTISPGYSAHFPKPNDWLRTIELYRQWGVPGVFGGGDRDDIDFRDEGGAFHANFSPLVLRYLTRDGLDATRWSTLFRNAVLAFLEYEEIRDEPKMAAVAADKLKFYKDAVQSAEDKDDTSERPRINMTGRFVRARYGHGNFDRKNAWPP